MSLKSELKKGSTATLVLRLLSEGPMYGYQIAREIERRSEGYFDCKEGTLYPALHKLEQEGLVRSEWRMAGEARRRKYYMITDEGRRALREAVGEWHTFSRRILALIGSPQI